jgi:hypothetical protein
VPDKKHSAKPPALGKEPNSGSECVARSGLTRAYSNKHTTNKLE